MSKYLNIKDFLQDGYSTTFIIGARGVGKTVSSFVESIKDCYEHDQKFIYLRRYQTEIDTLGLNLGLISKLTGLEVSIDNVKDESGRSVKMITAGQKVTMPDKDGKEKEKVTGKKALGYLLALSVASKYKSTDYTGTKIIIYDEFIDIRGRELKNEVNLFLNFSMTVFRDFSKYRALFLANATNVFNCYFVSFNVIPNSKITKNKKLSIKIVMYQTSKELDERRKTPLAKLVDFAGDSDSSLDNNFAIKAGYIGNNTKNAVCHSIIKLDGKNYGFWKNDDYYLISTKFNATTKKWIALDSVDDETYDYIPSGYIPIRDLLINHKLMFNNLMTRGIWFKYLKEMNAI